jgi:hypothetical protein
MTRLFASVVFALALSGCASLRAPPCADPQVQDVLYFGAAEPDGEVTAEEWSAFLADTVTPRFPDGLTAWEASGQWRGADGTIVREPSRVLMLLHADDAANDRAIREIVAAYKARFRQEAVLRVRTPACVAF